MSNSPFEDRTWIVTGAASGIGRAFASLAQARGARIMAWDANAAALDDVVRSDGLSAEDACVVDVRDADVTRDAARDVVDRTGAIDGIFHAAGILTTDFFLELPVEEHHRMTDVNFNGTINVAHAVLPHLIASKGRFAVMGSASAFHGITEFASYGAGKAAVLNFTQALRAEYADRGVRFCVVSPTFVDTPMLQKQQHDARFVRAAPGRRTPEFVAARAIRGITKGHFHVVPGWDARRVLALSLVARPVAHLLLRREWRKAGKRLRKQSGTPVHRSTRG